MRTLPASVRRRLDPRERYGLRLTLFALAITLVALPFGFLLAQVVREGPLVEVDASAAKSLHAWIRDRTVVIAVFRFFTEIGRPPFLYLASIIAIGFLMRRSRYRLAAYIATTGLLGGAIDSVVKILVDRDRPLLDDPIATAHGKSFPSGHAMSSTVVFGAILLAFMPAIPPRRRRLVIAGYVFLVLMIGLSRLALGVHFISDVIGGFVLGAAWLAAATAAFEIWRKERRHERVRTTADVIEGGVEPEARRDILDS